jgi:hypothetical protein
MVGSAFARHFNPLDSLTGNYLTIYLDTAAHPTLNGTPIVAGDEVGVFDSAGNCWGVGIWPSGATTTFPVAGHNVVAGVTKLGMKPGNVMYFRVWDTAAGEMPASVSFFPAGTAVPFNANVTPYTDSAYQNGNSALNPSVPSQITGLSVPAAPSLSTPTNGSSGAAVTLSLTWTSSNYAASYALQVSTVSTFASTVVNLTGITGLTKGVSGLANSTTYYWEVSATNTSGSSVWSGVWNFMTVVAPPAAPSLSAPSSGAQNQAINLTLSWASGSGATPVSYGVMVSTSSAFGTTVFSLAGITATSVAPTGLTNGLTYYWKVNATDAGGSGAYSSVASFGVIPLAPSAPALSAPSNGITGQLTAISLSWASASGATSYTALVSTGSTFASTIYSSVPGTALTAIPTGLAFGGITYYWQVGATNAGGTTWSGIWNFQTLAAPSAAPVLTSPSNAAANQAVSLGLSWSSAAGATSYGVILSSSSSFSTTTFSQAGLTSLSSTVSGLAYYTTYYWKAVGANAAGNGAWSVVSSFTTTAHLAIPLSNGYNLYSLNVHPADSSTTGIFKGLKGFLLAEDAYTNTWWPLGGVTTELDTLNTGSGYWIFDTSSTDTLKLTGAADVATTPISLLGLSYDLVAYLPQVNMPFETALASLLSPADTQLIIAEDGAGENIYWPAGGLFPQVDLMYAGTGYVMVTKANATLTYPAAGSNPAKLLAAVSGKPHMSQPPLRHYTKHSITGNSEILLSRQVEIGGKPASGSCEVGAFDTKGNLVGAGSVVNGVTAFNIWGQDPLTRAKDGCAPSEKISFRLWDGSKEYPLTVAGGNPVYAAKTILSVTLGVPAGANMSSFALPRLHPNPFRGSVTIAFDVPAISGSADQEVEIGVYDMRGSLVQRLAKARYAPGSYSVTWNGRAAGSVPGSGVYMVRMTANGFDKQVKLIEIK